MQMLVHGQVGNTAQCTLFQFTLQLCTLAAYLAVSQVGTGLPLEPKAQANNEVADLIVLVQRGVILALHIQDLAPQGQDGLEPPVAGLLGAAACR